MKIFFALLLLALLALLIPPLLKDSKPAGQYAALPWQVEVLDSGRSRVFGVTLDQSTLGEVRAHLGDDLELAVVAASNEPGTLEAYYESFSAGPVTGRLIVTMDATPEALHGFKQRTTKADYMATGAARKYALSAADRSVADQLTVKALSFIPSANLDAGIVLERFGAPAERLQSTPHTEHFLYPAKGLDVIVDSEGKELLQYVSPPRFDQLRAPLSAMARDADRPKAGTTP